MRKLLFVFLILGLTTFACADLHVKGKRVIYDLQGKQLTESDTPPANATEGERFRNIEENEVYIYKSGVWVIERKTTRIKALVQDTRDILAGANPDSNANLIKRLRNAERVIFLMLKEAE